MEQRHDDQDFVRDPIPDEALLLYYEAAIHAVEAGLHETFLTGQMEASECRRYVETNIDYFCSEDFWCL